MQKMSLTTQGLIKRDTNKESLQVNFLYQENKINMIASI